MPVPKTIDINMSSTPKELLDQFLSLGRIRKFININGITYQLNIDDEVKEVLAGQKRVARLEKRRDYYKNNKTDIYKRSTEYYRRHKLPNLSISNEVINLLDVSAPQVDR